MTLVRWRGNYSPFADLVELREKVNRLFEDGYGDWQAAPGLAQWTPAVDIVEKEDGIQISADLPGIPQEDIDVEVHDGTLTIKGEKKKETEVKEGGYHRIERTYGSFERSFTLPSGVKHDEIKASFRNGVLDVFIPKVEEAKPKKVSVEIKGE